MSVSAEVATLFLDELARRSVEVKLDEDGHYSLGSGDWAVKISLENLSRDFERDRDPEHVIAFVDSILMGLELPSWSEAETQIRWQLEPSDHQFGETLRKEISEKVTLVLACVDPSERQIRWLQSGDAEEWGKSFDELMEVAQRNMRLVLDETTLETIKVDEHRLGILNNERVAFKAALLCCPELKEVVEAELGWPLYAVMPCRDFVYILHQDDEPVLSRMGNVVLREYEESGYPLSTEVFAIDDEGVRAIGDFQPAAETSDDDVADEDGMRTIRYRGGIVTFRIPADWVDEYDENGSGTFYDDTNDAGTLRLSVITIASKTPVTTRDAVSLLESFRQEFAGELTELRPGNVLLRYSRQGEEDGDQLIMHYWQIANVVPPHHLRVAVFSYTLLEEAREDEDILEELAILEQELRACHIAKELGE